MILRYTPAGGAPQRFDLSEVRFLTSEAETLERTTGMDWDDLCGRRLLVVKKSPTARRAILWVLLKRNDPALRYAKFDPAVGEIDVKLGPDDIPELGAELEAELAKGAITEDEAEQGWADLDKHTDPDVLASGLLAARGKAAPQPEPAPEAVPPREDLAEEASPASA